MARDKNALTFMRGDSYPKTLTVADAVTKAPINLTGCTVILTVDTLENPPDNTTKVFDAALVPDPDQVANIGQAVFTPTTEQNGVSGAYYYDVQLTDAAGNVRTPIKSTYAITQDITK